MSVPQPENDRTYVFDGRTFALFSLQSDTYCIPVDEVRIVASRVDVVRTAETYQKTEEERCDELHSILRRCLGDEIVMAPIPFPPPGVDMPKVLECGFGKGPWIDDLLGRHDCDVCRPVGKMPWTCWQVVKVTGVDLFLGDDDEDDDDDDGENSHNNHFEEYERKRWNMNAPFRDAHSSSRLRIEYFHLINSRFLADGINADRWSSYIRELKAMLRRGGWLQMMELELRFQSDNGRLAPNIHEPLYAWSQRYRNSMQQRNKDPRIGQRLESYMQAAGFADVNYQAVRLEVGGWNSNASEHSVSVTSPGDSGMLI
jgi:hypothetical protein